MGEIAHVFDTNRPAVVVTAAYARSKFEGPDSLP